MYNIDPITEMVERAKGDIGELQGRVVFDNSIPAVGVRVAMTDIERYAITNESGATASSTSPWDGTT